METFQNKIFCEQILEFSDDYISEMETLNKSKNTILSYLNTIKFFVAFLEEYEKKVTFKNLKTRDFVKFLDYKSATLNEHKDAEPSSKALYIRHLQQFFSYIETESDESYDFASLFKRIKIAVPDRDPKGFEKDEENKILAYLESCIELANRFDSSKSRSKNPNIKINKQFLANRNSLIIKIILYSGLRVSELLRLSIKDLKIADDLYEIKIIGKGDKEAKIFLDINKVKNEVAFFKNNGYKLIAQSTNSKAIDRTQIWKLLKTIFSKSDVAKTGVHILRHTFAKTVYGATKDIVTVKEMLRHKSIQTTTIYAKESEQTTKNNYRKAIF